MLPPDESRKHNLLMNVRYADYIYFHQHDAME